MRFSICAVNTASACRAAKRRPVSDEPACTSTGLSLRTARHVERPGDTVELAAMIDRADAVRPRVPSGGAVVEHRVLAPAVPQSVHDGHEFLGAGIAVLVADLAGIAEIARRRRQPRGHDVPAGPPVADMVDRGELPRQVERLGIGRRAGRDQADTAGRHRQRGQHRDRFEPGARRLRRVLAERELIGEEDRVEFRRFRLARQILVVADVGQRQRRRVRMPPRRLVMAAAVKEQVEVQLARHRGLPA